MQNQYNQYNLEASFHNFLLAENISPITLKNYLSDFRHFAGWILQSNVQLASDEALASLINEPLVTKYKESLISDGLPLKSVNRRLSTIRKFCSFCISQGWMQNNPAKQVLNVVVPGIIAVSESADQNGNMELYQKYLSNKGYNSDQINKLVTDVSEIIN